MSNSPKKKLVTLTIDGFQVTARPGMTVKAAAAKAGITIPTLCFLRGVSAIGSCRVCSVELEGHDGFITACNTPVADGMVIHTDTERVHTYRRNLLRIILADHGLDSTAYCFSCAKNGACQLQALCNAYGATEPAWRVEQERKPILESNPFLAYDPNLCIRCQRCVGACNTQARNHTLHTAKRGMRTTIEAPFGPDWKATTCESCGCCAAACPTGAIVEKRRRTYRSWETHRVRTTCPHCAVGCQYDLVVRNNHIVDVDAAPGQTNDRRLCVKGRSASFDFVDAPDRLRTPLVRNPKTHELEPASWDEALDAVAEGLGRVKREYGPDALAGFACSRSTNEDIYLFEKMVRCAFGTNNVDNCARI